MSRPTPVPHRAALAALVAALVVGILGMHALTLHGPSSEAYAAAPIAAHGDHAATVHAATQEPATSGPAGSAAGYGSGQHADHLLMLCAAMLAVAALLLLARLLVRSVRPVRLVGAFESPAPTPAVRWWVRATGPPPAWRFSVIRC